MLHIITGRTGSGKTRKIRKLIADTAFSEPNKAVLIVPEQFSFETERAMLQLLGNEKGNTAEVLSFSRLAEKVLDKCGKLPDKTVDDSTRAILMSIAVESLGEKTVKFRRYVKNPALISELISFRKELKKYKIEPKALKIASGSVRRESFSLKLSELAEIFNCYDVLVHENFGDDTDYLDILCDALESDDYFSGKTVAVDGFSGFSGQEYAVLEKILKTSSDLYITFCYDNENRNGRYELFRNAHNEIKTLKDIANRAGVKIAPTENLEPKEEYKAPELNFLEKHLFEDSHEIFSGDANEITLMPCKNKKDECDAIASEIRRLTRIFGYRYRDIAVIERQEGSYKNELASSFRKYGIKCFFDSRQSVTHQPLTVFLRTLLLIINDGFSADNVLAILKTGLYGFTTEEIGEFEDYVLMWNINGAAFKKEWKDNPEGFGEEKNEKTEQKLAELNKLRERIVAPILSLKSKISSKNGETISKEIFMFLRNAGIDKNLKNIALALQTNGDSELSIEQSTVWQMITEIFDTLNFAVGKQTISISRYAELFDILVSSKDVGVIPSGVDEVIVGSADRIRASALKAVFVVGANEGVFPGVSSAGTLLSDRERTELIENNIELVSNLEYNSVSELFIAYRALTLSTDKLYVSFSSFDSDSSSLFPSDIVISIEKMFPNHSVFRDTALNRIESEKSAFSALAGESVNGSTLASSLYEYFKENSNDGKIQMINKIRKNSFELTDGRIAEELFGKDMYLTASRTEKYYHCPFEYFCEYGISAKPRKTAEVDPAQTGTLVHFVLETILREYPKEKLTNLSRNEAKEITDRIIETYVEEQMSGIENKNASFLRTVELIKDRTLKVVLRLIEEFKNCDFTPVDFELNIDRDGEIRPYELELSDGGKVRIRGKVDRVDSYSDGENNFIRIIDYKTGGKDFNLYEVLEGINMQMLIYLFAIWQNGGEKYGNVIPAGVLYFPAKAVKLTASKIGRYSDEAALQKAEKSKYQMKGLVLNNINVINAMEHGGGGVLIPSSIDKNGHAAGNVITLNSLYKLRDRVDSEIKNMAESLHKGKINAFPTEGACDYCVYKSVCKRESGAPVHEIEKLKFDEVLEILGGDDGE